MVLSTTTLLKAAQYERYVIGAFNVYNAEGVHAVVGAAEAERSPVTRPLPWICRTYYKAAVDAMEAVVRRKLRLFGSTARA